VPVSLKPGPYGGWTNCLFLSYGSLELIITSDVGPRVISCRLNGEANLFKEYAEQLGQSGGSEWRIYGGHRLWHAPEIKPRTYSPDNKPVAYEWDGSTLTLIQDVEADTLISKRLVIKMQPDSNEATIVHELRNDGLWAISTAPWCLTVLAAGGRAILPQEPFVPFPDALLPARPLVLWPYTNMHDPRFTFAGRYIELRQDDKSPDPQKIGLRNSQEWGLYERNGTVFLKQAPLVKAAEYPDFGSNWELFTNHEMLELETLGPLTLLEPGAAVEHTEIWTISKVSEGLGAYELISALGLKH